MGNGPQALSLTKTPVRSQRNRKVLSYVYFSVTTGGNELNPSLRRLGVIVLLSLMSIPLHELGHYTVYRLTDIPVHITLQSVRPITSISGPIAVLGLAAGPAFSVVAALACLLIAQQRPGFFWATAAFTNASIRLVPCAMDLLRAFSGGAPFSDEGDIAVALTHSVVARCLLILCVFAVSAILTVLAAHQYHYQKHSMLKVLGIYLLSLGVGIGVVLVDGLLHPMKM